MDGRVGAWAAGRAPTDRALQRGMAAVSRRHAKEVEDRRGTQAQLQAGGCWGKAGEEQGGPARKRLWSRREGRGRRAR